METAFLQTNIASNNTLTGAVAGYSEKLLPIYKASQTLQDEILSALS